MQSARKEYFLGEFNLNIYIYIYHIFAAKNELYPLLSIFCRNGYSEDIKKLPTPPMGRMHTMRLQALHQTKFYPCMFHFFTYNTIKILDNITNNLTLF